MARRRRRSTCRRSRHREASPTSTSATSSAAPPSRSTCTSAARSSGERLISKGATTLKVRPDLVVSAVNAPPQTLATRAVDVVVDLAELNGDTSARATVTLMLGPTAVAAPKSVTIAAGGTRSVAFEQVALTAPMTAELTVRVTGADPYETDETNNTRSRSIEVTEHELVRANVLVDALGGVTARSSTSTCMRRSRTRPRARCPTWRRR